MKETQLSLLCKSVTKMHLTQDIPIPYLGSHTQPRDRASTCLGRFVDDHPTAKGERHVITSLNNNIITYNYNEVTRYFPMESTQPQVTTDDSTYIISRQPGYAIICFAITIFVIAFICSQTFSVCRAR